MKRRIRIGYWDKTCKDALYFPGDAHLILIAPSGSGKGRDLLVPALIEHKASCIVIDPKGQLAAITGPHRVRMGQRVLVLNPFNIFPEPYAKLTHAGFNPLSVLDPASPSFGADCDSLAEAIVYGEGGGGDNAAYFVDSSRLLVSGVIMVLAAFAPPAKKNLVNLYEIINGGSRFYAFVRKAVKVGGPLGILIRGRLSRFNLPDAEKNKELTGIVNTTGTQIGFIGNDAIASSLLASGPVFRFSELRDKPTTVYLVLPTRYLATSAKWFRLVIAAAMADLLREERGRVPVLGIFDEFAQLGTLKVMSNIMGIGRGYNLQIWPILQDLPQLQKLYTVDWRTFLSGAGAQIFFAPREDETARWVSERCGDRQVVIPGRSVSETAWGTGNAVENIGVSTGYHLGAVPYLKPHQVYEIPGNEMLVFGENLPGVIRAGRKPYWEMPECRGKVAPDPYHPSSKWWPW